MLNRIVLFFLVLVLCFSCKKQEQIDGYTRDHNGYYYKLLAIGDGNEKPQRNQVVILDAVMKTQSDSVFWDTKHDATTGLYVDLNSEVILGSCNHYFLNMVEGDSASFLINTSVLFKNYFGTVVPDFCKHDSLVKLFVKLNQIISKPEYNELKRLIFTSGIISPFPSSQSAN